MSTNYSKQTNWAQFIPLVTVFFFWGFVAASNDILIPVFKKAFNLSQSQSQLVSLAFYIAYTVGSLIYMAVSKGLRQDLINKIGYKNGLILGLLISAAGTIGKTVIFDGEDSYFQDSNIVWIENDESKVTNQFLYYFLQTNQHP